MNVIEKLCDRIAFINKGQILKIGYKEDLKAFDQSEIKIEAKILENKNELKQELIQQNFIYKVIDIKEGFVIFLKSRNFYPDLLSVLSKYKILKVKELEISLEDLFLKIA